jgi:hypothetical protein
MAALALDYTYAYPRPSAILAEGQHPCLSLVTTSPAGRETRFFRGTVLHPKRTADLLLAVVEVVQSRFHVPPAMLKRILAEADPVITCGEDRLRFEGFSACCSAYARLDLLPNAVRGERFAAGTTNVDFNAPMRMALSRLREGDPLDLEVGAEGVEVRHEAGSTIERKVKLPVRWLRGFVEVQAYQARMRPRLEVSGVEFRRFLREAPKAWKGLAWVSRSGAGLRLSQIPGAGAVSIGGIARLRVLEPIARYATRVCIHASEAEGASGWELETRDSRFHLVLSPEVWRGFSGEGQALNTLAKPARERAMGAVRAGLRWQAKIDRAELAKNTGLEHSAVDWALAQCAASGLVGYDLAEQVYFHRELPFDLSLILKLQPRLADARKLVATGAVHIESRTDAVAAWVRSRGLEYHTVLDKGEGRCTCPWFAKYGESRGPCKHVLAVRIAAGEGDDAE